MGALRHEPRSVKGQLYCLVDGQEWPCPIERARRGVSLRHVAGRPCPACKEIEARVAASKAEARAALERSLTRRST